MRKRNTNVHFDYGGYYTEEHEWVSINSVYAISFKTASMEEITYSMLVEKICRKIALDETPRKLKLSYSVSNAARESYIVDDEDVFVYLTTSDEKGLRHVLHVELSNDDLEKNQRVDQISRAGRGSSFGKNYGESASNGRVDDADNAGILTIVRAGEIAEQHKEHINEEPMNDGNDFEAVDSPVDNHVDDRHEYVELPPSVQDSQYIEEWEDGTGLEKGQEFCSKEAVQDLVQRAAHLNCFGIRTVKSDTERLMLRCSQAAQGCKWYLRAARIQKSELFSVRVHRKMHTCSRAVASTSSCKQKGTPQIVASLLHEDYPGLFDTPTPKNIMSIVQGRLSLHVSYSTAWRGKKQHVSDVRGSPEKSYKMLYSYLYMLEKVNPGSVTAVELDAEKRFKYLFIALGASIEGFRAMRKVIVVDATFLKTVYGGMLVFATAQDPNHHHYPIAFGVIDSEKDASWTWFFKMLKTVIPDVPGLVFISDRHASIIKAVFEVYPSAHHGHCIWHLSQNVRGKVKKQHKDQAATKFRECAHIYTESDFYREYADFRSRFPKVVEYLDKSIELDKWARCKFPGEKYNIDTSNSAESLNSVFRQARKYSLLPMIDAILEKISEWFNKHRKEAAAPSDHKRVVPYVENELHTRCAIASHLLVTELNSFQLEYSVMGRDGKRYLVDLKMKTCSCRCFDIDKYPCVHAIAATRNLMRKDGRTANIQIYDLCSQYYLIDTWALAYYRTIYVVPHESKWMVPAEIRELFALPPQYTKKLGRNQETRFPSTGEGSRKRRNKSVPGINLERYLQPESPDE